MGCATLCRVIYRRLPLLLLPASALGAVVALAAVFAVAPASGLMNLTTPPVTLHWLPGLDEEVTAALVGTNYTSFSARVVSTVAPDAVCNPFLNLTARVQTSSGTLVLPFCWLPARGPEYLDTARRILYVATNAAWSRDGYREAGSILVYNASRFIVPVGWSLVYIGGGFQTVYYPGYVGGWSGGNDTLSFCLNVSVSAGSVLDELNTYARLYLYIGYYSFNGTALNYVGSALASIYSGSLLYWARLYNDTWRCYTVSFNPNDVGLVDVSSPGVYVVALAPLLVLNNTGAWFSTSATLGPVYMELDDVEHNVSLSGKGFYTAAPIFTVDDIGLLNGSWSLRLPTWSVSGIASLNYTVLSFVGLPLAGPPWSLAGTGGAGVVVVYGYMGASTAGSLVYNFSYGDGAVEARYPIIMDIVDPPMHGCRHRLLHVFPAERLPSTERAVVLHVGQGLALEASRLLEGLKLSMSRVAWPER